MEQKHPPDFDWVTARAACSIHGVFVTLQRQAELDVETFNALGHPRQARFEKDEDENSEFSVFRYLDRSETAARRVTFTRVRSSIVVEASGLPNRTLTMTLNDEGRCRLQINGAGPQLDHWQVLRALLEPMLFPPTEP